MQKDSLISEDYLNKMISMQSFYEDKDNFKKFIEELLELSLIGVQESEFILSLSEKDIDNLTDKESKVLTDFITEMADVFIVYTGLLHRLNDKVINLIQDEIAFKIDRQIKRIGMEVAQNE